MNDIKYSFDEINKHLSKAMRNGEIATEYKAQRDELMRRAKSVLDGLDDGLDAFGNDGAMPSRMEKLRQVIIEIEATK